MEQSRKQITASIFFIVLAILYLWGTTYIRVVNIFSVSVVSSATIPRLLGVLLLCLSVVLLIKSLRQRSSVRKNLSLDKLGNPNSEVQQASGAVPIKLEDEMASIEQVDNVSIILTVVSLAIFALLIIPLGFLISSTIYMILQTLVLTKKELRKKKLLLIVLYSVVFALATYFIFTKGLDLMLPAGILG